jgi:hypothetical protein
MGYSRMSQRIGVDLETRVERGVHWVDFHGLWNWRTEMTRWSLEALEAFHDERIRAVQSYVSASAEVRPEKGPLTSWFEAFTGLLGFMAAAYTFSKVAEERLAAELKTLRVPEVYLPQLQEVAAARCCPTESARALADYSRILDLANETHRFRQTVMDAWDHRAIAAIPEELLSQILRHATQYKVTRDVDFTLTREEAQKVVFELLVRDLARNQTHLARRCAPQEVEFLPGQKGFHRVVRLCFEAAKLREDSHHVQVRGMWRFLDALDPVIHHLICRNILKERNDAFAHAYPWLFEKCEGPPISE